MRKHGRIDANHKEIVDALRGIGASVLSLANLGNGAPDLLVSLRGENFLLEVKTAKGRLTEDEMRFMSEWSGQINIVRNVEQAIEVVTEPRARFVPSQQRGMIEF